MTEQTVCLRAPRTRIKPPPVQPGTFTIEVPAHLAHDLGLGSANGRVICCNRPPQLGQLSR